MSDPAVILHKGQALKVTEITAELAVAVSEGKLELVEDKTGKKSVTDSKGVTGITDTAITSETHDESLFEEVTGTDMTDIRNTNARMSKRGVKK